MNPSQPFQPWVAPLGWLALEAALVALAALAVQPLLRTAAARRSLWRAALLAMLAVLALELTGTGSQLPAQLRLAWQTTFPAPVPPPDPPPALEELPFTPPPIFSLAPTGGEARREGAFPAPEPLQLEPASPLPLPPLSLSHSPTFSPAPTPWPAFLWLTGLAALLTRAAWTHAGFAWLRLRHFLPAAEALRERVQSLATRLGLRRRVRVLASARLHAPAAFGWLRPGVGVPGDFTARFAPAQQEVMLAHELAHLAARDPLWQLLADLAIAALWWHPLAWVARHQHRLAAELAADDASQALPDGPVVLAECLLVLGQEAAAAPRAPLGMAGFRSQLGRRVERLVALPRRDWSAPGPLRLALQTTTALLALAALALLPGCAANRSASEPPARLVAKWWQAKSKTSETQPRGATLLIRPQPKPVTIEGRVRFNGTAPPERDIPIPLGLVKSVPLKPTSTMSISSVTSVTNGKTNIINFETGLRFAVEQHEMMKALIRELSKGVPIRGPVPRTPSLFLQDFCLRHGLRHNETTGPLVSYQDGQITFLGSKADSERLAMLLGGLLRPPLKTRNHRVSSDGGLADVLVYVKEGLADQTFTAPTNLHVIRIESYEYQPYITAVQTGQPIRWETDVNLNFHPTPTNPANREFNRTLMPGRPVEATFTAPEFFLRTKDDVHPWLFGYVSVLPHPFFAVTDAEGRFRFPQPLPPGKYTLAAVHRQAGTETRELVVDADFDAAKPIALTLGAVTGRDAIFHKLAETHLPEVTYDGFPLPEVVKMLNLDAKKHDPAKRGVRFDLWEPKTNSPAAVNLETVLIKVTTVLRDVSVLEALDAILKTADAHRPTDGKSAALEYHIETDRVVFRERTKPAASAASAPAAMAQRQREIRQRLEAVALPSVQYDGLPLPEVIKFLGADAKRYDPEKKGFNFLVSSTGQPGSAEQQVDLDTVLIQHATVRKNATVREVLDAICQTAEVKRPDGVPAGLKYSVEGFGILFTPDHSRAANAQPAAPPVHIPPHAPLPAATPPTSAPPSTSRPINAALAREHCDRLEALVKAVRANPATTAQDYANVAGLIEQALTEYAAVLPPTAPELARLKKLLDETKPLAKPRADNAPVPAAAKLAALRRAVQIAELEERRFKQAEALKNPNHDPRAVIPYEAMIRSLRESDIEANPQPAPKPGAVAPVGDDVRSLTPTQTRIILGSEAPTTVLAAGDSVRIQISHLQNGTNQSLAYRGEIAPSGYVPIPRASKAVFVAGKTIEEAARMIREQLVRDGLESPRVTLDKAVPFPVAPPGTVFRRPTDTYRIHAGDELIVSVWGRDDLRTKGKVQSDGRMTLPLVEAVPVAGSTLSHARAAIKAAYQPAHLAEAHVAVQLIRSVQPPTNGMAALSYPTLPDLVVLHPLTLERLAKVRLPEVSFNAVSLPAVLQQLNADTLRLDPGQDGIKFEVQKGLFTATAFDPPPSSDPVKYTNASGAVVSVRMNGSPSRSRVRLNFDMDTVSVSLPSALRGVAVLDALEAIVTGADYPIRYTIETNRVIFWQRHSNEPSPTPKPPAPKPGASAPAPSPFAERGEKVAEGRLRGAATHADAANPSPQLSPLSAKREREPESVAPPASQSLATSSPTPVQLVAASPKGVTLPVPNPYHRTNSQVPFLTHSSKGAQRINRKLEEIVLPEVHFDAVPLVGVVQRLSEDAKKFDPEPDPAKKGLNFLINDAAPAAPLLDAVGNPVPVARPVDLSEGLVRVTQPLKNLTLRQALDVICKTAELPTQFSVEEYAIAFIPRGPVAYYSRIFRVNPDTFIQGLQGVVGNPVLGVTPGVGNAPGAAGQNQPTTTPAAPVRATVPATVPATQRTAAEANALVRQFFQSAGVTALGATNGSTRVTFNPANGLLQVRGTTNDLRLIEQAIQKVQPSGAARPDATPQVTPPTHTNAPTSSTPSSPAKPVVKVETRIFKLEESLKNLTGVSLANSLRLDSPGLFTNQVVRAADVRSQFSPPLTTNQLPADGRMECEYYEARTQLAVVMSAARREALLNSLARSREWDAWSAPTLRTASGFRGQVQSVDINSVVVGQPKPETASKHVVTVATGVTLDLLPTLTTDASALRLGYLADVREFLGYAPTSKNPPEAVPRFRVRQAVGTNTLAIGESLLLTVAATVPPPGSGPGAAPGGAERTLLVLLTATLEESTAPITTNAAPRTDLPKPNPYYRTNAQAPFNTQSGKGAQLINRKLDEIILPELRFDSETLPEVVKWLDTNARKFDPERKGLNFLINNVMSDYISQNPESKPTAPLLDPRGNPIPANPRPAPALPDMGAALVKLPVAVPNLTLRQALDAICKATTVKLPDGRSTALKYSAEGYAIVFSPKLPEQAELFSRIFKVDPERFITGLRNVVDEKQFKPGTRAALEQALREKTWTNAPAGTNRFTVSGVSVGMGGTGVVNTNVTSELNQLVRHYFTTAGVANLGVTNGPDATQVFFNDRNGLLLVRASLPDLDIIQQAIELLNAMPPQVLVETKIGGVNQSDNKALGYDWRTVTTNANPLRVAIEAKLLRVAGDDTTGKTLGFDWFLGNAQFTSTNAPATNYFVHIDREGNYLLDGRVRSLNQLEAELGEAVRTNPAVRLRINAVPEANYSDAVRVFERASKLGITNSSFTTLREPLPTPSSKATVAPRRTTFTGILTEPQMQVVWKAVTQRPNMNVLTLPGARTESGKPATLAPAAGGADSDWARGLKLQVLPSVEADGLTVRVQLTTTRDGKPGLETTFDVRDRQTVMLGNLESAPTTNPAGPKPSRTILFLTPTLVDHTGKRIHLPDEEMPFAPAGRK